MQARIFLSRTVTFLAMRRRRFLELGAVGIGAASGCIQQRLSGSSDRETPETPVWTPQEPPAVLPPEEVLGATHSNGAYHFSEDDFLNEGAKRLSALGTNVIKIWLHRTSEKYSFNSDWPRGLTSLTDVAQTDYVRELFERPFSTYVLLAHSRAWGDWLGFQEDMSDRKMRAVRNRLEDLTRHLLSTYDGTGKTFVFQHWEGDNLAQDDRTAPLPDPIAENFRRWLTARQEGVERGRNAVESDVTVVHAPEVNFVLDAKNDGTARVINEVIPEVDVDMVSYSAWEMGDQLAGYRWAPGHNGQRQFDEAESVIHDTLDYIDSQAPEPNDYVAGLLTDQQSNVYLGEFGSPFQRHGSQRAMRIIRPVLEHSLDWGVRWALYWQLYCNEERVDGTVTKNSDVQGYYLIRPDGTRAPTWEYFSSVLNSDRTY